jgi:hypothetical protein
LNIFKAVTIICILISAYALYTNGLLIRLFGEKGVIVIDKYAHEVYDKLPDNSKILPLPEAPKTVKTERHSTTISDLDVRVSELESNSYMLIAIMQVIVPLIIPALMYRFRSHKGIKESIKELSEEKKSK